jgi:hypothetical protein
MLFSNFCQPFRLDYFGMSRTQGNALGISAKQDVQPEGLADLVKAKAGPSHSKFYLNCMLKALVTSANLSLRTQGRCPGLLSFSLSG